MDLNYIMQQTHIMTYNLVEKAKTMCVNHFSSKIYYIKVSAEELNNSIDSYERQKKMINFLIRRKLLNEKDIALEIEKQQENLNWIDFELFHTSVITVIMAIFVPKEEDHKDLQFHSCLMTPPWADENFNPKYLNPKSLKSIIWNVKYRDYLKSSKFDVNWQQKSLSARWKIFLWKKHIPCST